MVIASTSTLSAQAVWEALRGVMDPEIPALSVVDLGIIEEVKVDGDNVDVTCLPTFVACPALEVIGQDIVRALESIGAAATVRFVFDPPWTTERISEEGRRRLKEYGLAPPETQPAESTVRLSVLSSGPCPYCGSRDTVLESPFGPTLCRATCYCRSCRNPFEKFKEL